MEDCFPQNITAFFILYLMKVVQFENNSFCATERLIVSSYMYVYIHYTTLNLLIKTPTKGVTKTICQKIINLSYSKIGQNCPLKGMSHENNPYVVVAVIFIKGPVYKLHIKFSAFTAHLPLKVQDFSKVLSLACSGLGNNCIFAYKIFK